MPALIIRGKQSHDIGHWSVSCWPAPSTEQVGEGLVGLVFSATLWKMESTVIWKPGASWQYCRNKVNKFSAQHDSQNLSFTVRLLSHGLLTCVPHAGPCFASARMHKCCVHPCAGTPIVVYEAAQTQSLCPDITSVCIWMRIPKVIQGVFVDLHAHWC